MALRTSQSEVKLLLTPGGNYSCADLTIFIRIANRVINRVITCAASKGITIDSATAKDMETAYAAHMYTRADPTYKSRSTLSASGSWNTDGTEFLQVALALDESGCLATIVADTKSKVAGGAWLGKKPSQKTSYNDWDTGVTGLG